MSLCVRRTPISDETSSHQVELRTALPLESSARRPSGDRIEVSRRENQTSVCSILRRQESIGLEQFDNPSTTPKPHLQSLVVTTELHAIILAPYTRQASFKRKTKQSIRTMFKTTNEQTKEEHLVSVNPHGALIIKHTKCFSALIHSPSNLL